MFCEFYVQNAKKQIEKPTVNIRNFAEQVQMHPRASKRFQMHPRASERIPADPNASEWVRTCRKASKGCDKVEELCENFEKFRDNVYKHFFHSAVLITQVG